MRTTFSRWLRSLRDGTRTHSAVRLGKHHVPPASLSLERLEDRTVLSPFYDVSVVARTTDGFVGFGDLPSINNAGTVAFVGFTDEDSDGVRESGLWTRAPGRPLVNVNPEFSDSNGRNFGRAVAINDKGFLTARDQIGTHFDVRSWNPITANENAIVATTTPGPGYGKYAGLQTFTAINNAGDVAFVGMTAAPPSEANFRTLELHLHGTLPQTSIRLDTFPTGPAGGPTPRPQLTDDGRVLARLTNGTITLFNPSGGLTNFASAKDGFIATGAAPGITKDGRVVVFAGDRGRGKGIFASYYSRGTRHIVRIAGEGLDGWTGFDLNSAVRVGGSVERDRAVTVAFEGTHATLGQGIYTARVSLFGFAGNDFFSDLITDARVSGAAPVALVGDRLDVVSGPAITDLELYGMNDRGRGDLAFWVKTGAQEAILSATPNQVVFVNTNPTLHAIGGQTAANLGLLEELGLTAGWTGSFHDAMRSVGYTGDTVALAVQVRHLTQAMFDATTARVRILPSAPASVARTATDEAGNVINAPDGLPLVNAAYQTVQVGQAPTPDGDHLGLASPVYSRAGALDFFNQVVDDAAVVFADRVMNSHGFSQPLAERSDTLLAQAFAAVIAHEVGHNFGLVHTRADLTDDVMHAATNPGDFDEPQSFSQGPEFVDPSLGVPGAVEAAARRLVFAAGGPVGAPADPPNPAILERNATHSIVQRYLLAGSLTGGPVTVARLLAGAVSPFGHDLLPEFQDLGSGNLSALLNGTPLTVGTGGSIVLIGSTTGATADIIGIPVGQAGAENSLSLSVLGVATDARLLAPVGGGGPAFALFQLTSNGPVQIGTVAITGEPAAGVFGPTDAALTSGGTLHLGSARRGGGPLTQTVTIRNTGTDTLSLGTVIVTGTGYAVTQPGSTTLTTGASTTFTVTLSDATPGVGIAGTLTIPSNDPAGPFTVTLRGDVIAKPEVLAITRLDDGTGPLRIAVDFSERLQVGPASDVKTFTLVYGDATLALATAGYSEFGGVNRVTLTSAASGPFAPGRYEVRFNGAALKSLSGTPAATPSDKLLVGTNLNGLAAVAPAAAGGFQLAGSGQSLGFDVPTYLATGDLNGDGIIDLVTTSERTAQIVFFYGRPEGGFDDPTSLRVNPDGPTRVAYPVRAVVADWNADGKPDLVVLDSMAGDGVVDYGDYTRLLVLLNDGGGRFTDAPDTPIPLAQFGGHAETLTVGDFLPAPGLEVAMRGPQASGGGGLGEGSVQVIGKDPFLGYSRLALLENGRPEWAPQQVVAADFNGDGRTDLLASNTGYYLTNPRLSLNLGTADGFADTIYPEYDGEGGAVAVGDFTGDGRPDVAIVYDNFSRTNDVFDGGTVAVLQWNSTAGNLVGTDHQLFNRRGVSIAGAADLNRDGNLDLLVRADAFELLDPEQYPHLQSTPENSLLTAYGRGDGTFRLGELAPVASGGNLTPGGFAIGDFTGDGYPDAVFGNTTRNRLGQVTNDTTGVLRTAGPNGPTTGSFVPPARYGAAYQFQTADFNRDGLPDLLRGAKGLDVLLGTPSGGYALANTVLTTFTWRQIGDVNRDGVPDLVVAKQPFARVYFGNGDGTFRPGPAVPVAAGDEGGGYGQLADVNRDGNLDLEFSTTANRTKTGFAVYFGDGAGNFVYNPNTAISVPGLDLYVSDYWAVADVTTDGVPDLVVSALGAGYVTRVYPGRGNGTFAAAVDSPGGNDIRSPITLLDFNADGKPDIARFARNQVTLYAGSGDGRFTDVGYVEIPSYAISEGVGQHVTSLAPGDFDQDGKVDLGVTLARWRTYDNVPWTQAVVLRGNGSGGFAPTFFEVGANIPAAAVVVPADTWVSAGAVTPALPPAPPSSPPLDATSDGRPVRVSVPAIPGVPQLIAVTSPPTHGTVAVIDNGTPNNPGDDVFLYTPAAGYTGSDGWSYMVGNAGGAVTGSVSVVTARSVFAFSAAAYAATYQSVLATVTVLRSGDVSRLVTVDYHTADGTARQGSDYLAASGTLTFAPGETTATFTVRVLNRSQTEPRTVLVALNSDGFSTLGTPSTAVLTLAPVVTPKPTFAFRSATFTPEDDTRAIVTVTRSVAIDGFADVSYRTTAGTAVAGVDYIQTSGSLFFVPGETTKSFLVTLLRNPTATAERTIHLSLTAGTGSALGTPAAAVLTLPAPDRRSTVSFSADTVTAGRGPGTTVVTVVRSGDLGLAASVAYAVTGDTAIPGTDFTPVSGTLTFLPGQASGTFAVTRLTNPFPEVFRAARLTLTAGENAALGAIPNAALLLPAPLSATFAVPEDTRTHRGATVATLLATLWRDVDPGARLGAAVTGLFNPGQGTWQYSLNQGRSWLPLGAVSEASARLLRGTDRLRFLPAVNFQGRVAVRFRAWDQSAGAAGRVVNLTAGGAVGGASAVSAASGWAVAVITPSNDRPVLDPGGAIRLGRVVPGEATPPGDTVASLLGASVTDPDQGAARGIAVVAVTGAPSGVWQFQRQGTTLWVNVGKVSAKAALLLAPQDRVRFVPRPGFAGVATLTYRAWDQTVGRNGIRLAIGTSSAFSLSAGVATLTVTPTTPVRNNAPVLDVTSSPAFAPVPEDARAPAGQPVALLVNQGFSDADQHGGRGVAITGLTGAGAGTWQYSVNRGKTWTAVAPVSAATAVLLRDTDLLRFVPRANFAGQVSLTYRAWDRTRGSAGGRANLLLPGVVGGQAPFSEAEESATLTVIAINDRPVLNTVPAVRLTPLLPGASDPAGDPVASFLGAAVTDADAGSLRAIAVVGATGVGGWSYRLEGGAWTPLGPVSKAAAILLRPQDEVRFVPNPSFVGTALLSYRAWDQTVGQPGERVPIPATSTAYSTAVESAAVVVNGANDRPTLDIRGIPALTPVLPGAALPAGDPVAELLRGAVLDVDPGAVTGIAVTGFTATGGRWEYSLDNGTTWLRVAAVWTRSALLLRSTDRLRYVPTGPGGRGQVRYRAWDQTVGTAGAFADVTSRGVTAFSVATETAAVVVNTAPELRG